MCEEGRELSVNKQETQTREICKVETCEQETRKLEIQKKETLYSSLCCNHLCVHRRNPSMASYFGRE